MKKNVLAVLLASAVAASLIGCGGNSEAPAQTQETTDAAEAETSAEQEAPDEPEPEIYEAEEPVTATITVWGPEEDQPVWLPTMCEQFSAQHPNWDLTFEFGICAEGDAKENVTQDVEGAADVFMLANDNIPALVDADALTALGGSYLEAVTSTNSDSIVTSVTYNDSVWAFPFTSNTWFMYYDKSVFTEEDIKSLDTMLEKGKVSFPLSDSWYIAAFYIANGGTVFGDGTDEEAGIDFGGERGAAVTDYLVDLAANANFVSDAEGAGIAGLRDGSVNAVFSGTWDAASVKEILGDNMGVAALPTANIGGVAGQLKSFMGSKAVGVNPNCENMEVAMALAAYLAGEEAQMAHYELRNVLPTNTSITLVDDKIATAVIRVMTDTSITQPVIPAMNNYWTPAENMGIEIVAGEVTHDNAAEKTEEMNQAMNTETDTETDIETDTDTAMNEDD
ncbi:MAG: extracellular solute-binding protein [Lachnospiraceae bacterium]|nr:extracellular solute-binding protein [Lachnospiraceae bacterium]